MSVTIRVEERLIAVFLQNWTAGSTFISLDKLHFVVKKIR